MNAKIGFKLQVTATPGFHLLQDWWCLTMWLFSGVHEDPENDTVMEKDGAEALYSAVKSLMHVIRTKDKEAQQNAAHRMLQIGMPLTIRQWSEFKLAYGKPLVRLPNKNAHLIDVECTEEGQAHLQTLMERYTVRGASGALRVYRWRLPCFTLVLRVTEHCNNVSGQWHNEWPLDTSVELLIFRWLRDTVLAMLVKEPAEYPEPDQDDAPREMHLPPERNETAPPCAPPLQKAVLICPLPGQLRHLKWWLTKFFVDNVDMFHMYAEMGNDERTEMQLKFQVSRNLTVFITTHKVGGIGLNFTTANHAGIT